MTTLTDKQELALAKHEQAMRDNAVSISNLSVKMQDIDKYAARKALIGIVEYLQEAINDIK